MTVGSLCCVIGTSFLELNVFYSELIVSLHVSVSRVCWD